MVNIMEGGYSTENISEIINTSLGKRPNININNPPNIQNKLCFSVIFSYASLS